MLKTITFILCMIISIMIGFGSAYLMYHPDMRTAHYSLGVVPFCQLIESDRLKVCPLSRVSKTVQEGGVVTIYMCDNRHMFIETNNVPEKPVKEAIKTLEEKNIKVIGQCKTEFGKVYELMVRHE